MGQHEFAATLEGCGGVDGVGHSEIVAPGMVKDSRTGLEWMRCSLGQDWSEKSKTCTGSVNTYTWQGALDITDKRNAVPVTLYYTSCIGPGY